jgi:hypothetical protein
MLKIFRGFCLENWLYFGELSVSYYRFTCLVSSTLFGTWAVFSATSDLMIAWIVGLSETSAKPGLAARTFISALEFSYGKHLLGNYYL